MLISDAEVFNGNGNLQRRYDEFSNRELGRIHEARCPNGCGRNCLRIHGYYSRDVEFRGEVARVRVARLSCDRCGRTHALLSGAYGLGLSDRVWVCGDLVSYIRNFIERITACGSVYVPDKWHVCNALSDAYPEFGWILPGTARGILDVIVAMGDPSRLGKRDAIEIVRLYRKDPSAFDRWDEAGYAECSQEGMNPHYYAPRLAKPASRFKAATVEKPCSAIESERNGRNERSTRPR